MYNTSMAGWSDPLLSKQCIPVSFAINSMGQGELISSIKLAFLFSFQDAPSPRFRVA